MCPFRHNWFVLTWVAFGISSSAAGEPPVAKDIHGDPLPPGAVARLGTTRLRFGGIDTSAVSPDGRLLATARDGRVRLWNLETGKELKALGVHPLGQVCRIHFSQDGKRIAVVSDLEASGAFSNLPFVCVFEVETGRVRFHSKKAEEPFMMTDAGFLDGGKLLVTNGGWPGWNQGGEVRLWDLATGKSKGTLTSAISFACSPDGRLLATGHEDGRIDLWDSSGKQRRSLKGHPLPVGTLEFSPDGKCLASFGGADWSKPRGGDFGVFGGGGAFGQFGGPWSRPDKPYRRDGTVRLWEVATGKELQQFMGHVQPDVGLRFSPDGRALAAMPFQHNPPPPPGTMMPMGKFGAFGGGFSSPRPTPHHPYTTLLWNVGTGESLGCFPDKPFTSYWWNQTAVPAFSADGKTAYHSPGDGSVQEIELKTGKQTRRWQTEDCNISTLVCSPDGKRVVAVGEAVAVWDRETGKQLHSHPGHTFGSDAVTFTPDGEFLASVDGKHFLHLWEVRTGRHLLPRDGDRPTRVRRFSFVAEGPKLTTLSWDAVLRTWELPSGRLLAERSAGTRETEWPWQGEENEGWRQPTPQHQPGQGDRSPLFSPDGALLAIVIGDGQLEFWDTQTGQRTARLEGAHKLDAGCVFSPDSKAFAAVNRDGSVGLFQVATGKPLARLEGCKGNPYSLAFAPDGKTFGATWDKTVRVWDLSAGKEKARWNTEVTDNLIFDLDGRALVLSDFRGVEVWDHISGQSPRQYAKWEPSWTSAVHRTPNGRVAVRLDGELRELASKQALSMSVGGTDRFAFSSDGRILVASPAYEITLHETATAKEIATLNGGNRGTVGAVAISPDGRFLATGAEDSAILLWDLRAITGLDGKAAKRTPGEAWGELESPTPAVAFRAAGSLAADPASAVLLLKERLRPVTAEDAEPVRRLLRDLDSRDFSTRQRAVDELAKTPAEWVYLLREVLDGKPPLEVRRRLEPLMASPSSRQFSPGLVRNLRALQALEQMGTPEARALIERLASGLAEARLTQEAKAALGRVKR